MKNDVEIRENYHHGNLPETLIRKGAELLAEKGAEKFSMREVARRAGVAVAAPAHHFGNAKGLLTTIATVAFERLTLEQTRAVEAAQTPEDKVVALTQTYIDMSTRYPGYAAVLFRWDLIDHEDKAHAKAAAASFDFLKETVAAAAPAGTTKTHIEHTSKAVWAMAHGFVTLSMTNSGDAKTRTSFAVKALLSGLK